MREGYPNETSSNKNNPREFINIEGKMRTLVKKKCSTI